MRTKIKPGDKHWRLLVLSREKNDTWGQSRWRCLCDCGNEVVVGGSNLTRGNTQSCGCLKLERTTIHGQSGSRLYFVHAVMKRRCDNPNDPSYPLYGGRGISYDPCWFDFTAFERDMGSGYAEGLTLERRNPNGMYNKQNCAWVPLKDQAYSKTKFSTNKSGISGVHYDKWGNRWKARWHEYQSGKGRQKCFPVAKFGEDEAFRLACEYRFLMIEEQIKNGAPYTEYHGVNKNES